MYFESFSGYIQVSCNPKRHPANIDSPTKTDRKANAS